MQGIVGKYKMSAEDLEGAPPVDQLLFSRVYASLSLCALSVRTKTDAYPAVSAQRLMRTWPCPPVEQLSSCAPRLSSCACPSSPSLLTSRGCYALAASGAACGRHAQVQSGPPVVHMRLDTRMCPASG